MTVVPEQQKSIPDKFEALLRQAGSADVPGMVEIGGQYRAAVTGLERLIDDDRHLEPQEKQLLHGKVEKLLGDELGILNERLRFMGAREKQDHAAVRERLYKEAVTLVENLSENLGRQIDKAADWGVITDEEFESEIKAPFDYLHTDIPGLDSFLQIALGQGLEPKEAMQKAVNAFLRLPNHRTVFNIMKIQKEYPEIRLEDHDLLCMQVNTAENLRNLDGRPVRKARGGELFQVLEPLPDKGRYKYNKVLGPDGKNYKLCANDGDRVVLLRFRNGKFGKAADETQFAPPLKVAIKPQEAPPAPASLDEPSAQPELADLTPKTPEKPVAKRIFTIAPSVAATLLHERQAWTPHNPIPREAQKEALCASYVQRYLAGAFGQEFLKASGFLQEQNLSESDAWMIAGNIEKTGYAHTGIDMSLHFQVDKRKKTVRLDERHEGYRADLDRLMDMAGSMTRSRMGLLLFHYKHTKANEQIFTGLDKGGSLNSHATIVLGWGVRLAEAKQPGSAADAILASTQDRIGKSYDNAWRRNRFMLGYLRNVTVDGQRLEFKDGEFIDARGAAAVVQSGSKISYEDIQLTDFYHNESKPGESPARMVGLTELMIQGNFDPVKLMQWDPQKVDVRVETPSKREFIIGQFSMDASIKNLPERIGMAYDELIAANLDFMKANPDRAKYIRRTINYYVYIKAIPDKDALPPDGAILHLLDWSKKPRSSEEIAAIAAREKKKSEKGWLRSVLGSLTSPFRGNA
ncbi:hypothetical protein HZA43_05285 [Candidatus Peregrinibacteria bacterium]|nr:hypothetical protein [Candidatus Peregrinibacteria bacterium]